MKCGKCKEIGPEITSAHVRACYGVSATSGAFQVHEPGQDSKMVEIPGLGVSVPRGDAMRTAHIGGNKQTPSGGVSTTVDGTVYGKRVDPAIENAVPAGRYAILDDAKVVRFFRVDKPTEGRWAGMTFVKRQAGDDLHPVKYVVERAKILRKIAEDPKAAMIRYGHELGACGMCGRTLTNPESIEAGIGPICAAKF